MDRRLRAFLILVGASVLGAGMWLGVLRYYRVDTAAPRVREQYAEHMERMRAEEEFAEGAESGPPALPAFSGMLSEQQQRLLVASLSQHRGQAVVLRPAGAGSEGSAISPSASRAAAEQFAQVFWKSGWAARLLEPGDDRRRFSAGLVVVANPDPPTGRGQLAAQAFLAALEKAGIRARRANSYRVDPETFELHLTVEAGSN